MQKNKIVMLGAYFWRIQHVVIKKNTQQMFNSQDRLKD